jgi:TrmH family RNA methyltransferase
VSDDVLRKLSTTRQPQSPVAVLEIPEPVLPEDGHLLAAWGLGDPGNTGTLLRTAAAFELGFAAGPGTADLWSPKVLRSAMGGHWRARCGIAADLEDLRGSGRVLAATVVAGGVPPAALGDAGDVALLIGEEAAGLAPEVVAAADLAVTIPMRGGTESLNAAAAGAILAYELSGGGREAPSRRD